VCKLSAVASASELVVKTEKLPVKKGEVFVLLAFSPDNQLAIRRQGASAALAFVGPDRAAAEAALESVFRIHTAPVEYLARSKPCRRLPAACRPRSPRCCGTWSRT
jgi:hypothetical protein